MPRYMVWVEVAEDPQRFIPIRPRGDEVASEIADRIVGHDLHTGWIVTDVTS